MVGRAESPPSFEYSCSYIAAVQDTFQDEPAKYDLFKKLLNDYKAKRYELLLFCWFALSFESNMMLLNCVFVELIALVSLRASRNS